jgi:hypothetical protein
MNATTTSTREQKQKDMSRQSNVKYAAWVHSGRCCDPHISRYAVDTCHASNQGLCTHRPTSGKVHAGLKRLAAAHLPWLQSCCLTIAAPLLPQHAKGMALLHTQPTLTSSLHNATLNITINTTGAGML